MELPSTPLYPFPNGSLQYGNGTPERKEWFKQNWTNFLSEITVAKYTADVIGSHIQEASEQQIQAIQESSILVAGTVSRGFFDMSILMTKSILQDRKHHDEIIDRLNLSIQTQREAVQAQVITNNILSKGFEQLDWRLNLILEQQNASVILLEKLDQLLRIPESQKERQHHIELGLELFKKSNIETDFYNDAVDEFLRAEKLNQYDSFVLYHLGIIFLYAIPMIDLERAENYLIRSAKYSILEKDSSTKALSLDNEIKDYYTIDFTAKCNYEASIACYVQGKFVEGINHIDKALKYVSDKNEYLLLKMKLLIGEGNISEASRIGAQIFDSEPSYANIIINEIELVKHEEITDLIKIKVFEYKSKILDQINMIKKDILKGSCFQKDIEYIENYYSSDPNLNSYIEINKLLNESRYYIYKPSIAYIADTSSFLNANGVPKMIPDFFKIERIITNPLSFSRYADIESFENSAKCIIRPGKLKWLIDCEKKQFDEKKLELIEWINQYDRSKFKTEIEIIERLLENENFLDLQLVKDKLKEISKKDIEEKKRQKAEKNLQNSISNSKETKTQTEFYDKCLNSVFILIKTYLSSSSEKGVNIKWKAIEDVANNLSRKSNFIKDLLRKTTKDNYGSFVRNANKNIDDESNWIERINETILYLQSERKKNLQEFVEILIEFDNVLSAAESSKNIFGKIKFKESDLFISNEFSNMISNFQ